MTNVSVVPDLAASPEVAEPPASPAVVALREELDILHHIFSILSAAAIRAAEAKKAVVVLDYLDGKISNFESAIAEQLTRDAVVAHGVNAVAEARK
jgi:hypothetical protein